MVRLLITLLATSITLCGSTQAQWFSGKRFSGKRLFSSQHSSSHHASGASVPNKYRTPYPTTPGRMSIGVFSYPDYNYPRPGEFDPYRFDNYVYDPFQTGSFRAPDLLNDPYFRERHRYDSHFPGRRKPPLALQTPSYGFAYPSPRNPALYHGSQQELRARPLVNPPSGSAPEKLAQSLAARQDGEAWMEFLDPMRVQQLIDENNADQISEMLSRYDGIANNSDLRAIVGTPGFQETRELLRQYAPRPAEVAPENIPVPSAELLSSPQI